VEIVVTGRHVSVSDWFRTLAEEKLTKVAQLAPKAYRANVEVSHERNPRQSSQSERVEITLRGKGPVIRAEASSDDQAAALDLALGKLLERLRRNGDRRKVHHGRQRPATLRMPGVRDNGLAAALAEPLADEQLAASNGHVAVDESPADGDAIEELADSPVVIRTKVHDAAPMTVEQALYEMELVGHDFFLFVDAGCGRPSVVYRRRGWNYGVIRLGEQSVESVEASAQVPVVEPARA